MLHSEKQLHDLSKVVDKRAETLECEGWVLGKRLRRAITKVQKAESS